jgi:hypothetical protein
MEKFKLKKRFLNLTCQIRNVKFVTKNENPASFLECKPAEMFWYLLKVYKDDWCALNLKQLKRKIRACVSKVQP